MTDEEEPNYDEANVKALVKMIDEAVRQQVKLHEQISALELDTHSETYEAAKRFRKIAAREPIPMPTVARIWPSRSGISAGSNASAKMRRVPAVMWSSCMTFAPPLRHEATQVPRTHSRQPGATARRIHFRALGDEVGGLPSRKRMHAGYVTVA
jgi:hypothetical protein